MVELRATQLTIALDADSARSDRCAFCVTIELDSLFALTNVVLVDPIRVEVTYVRDRLVRTLRIDRFSGGGRVANVLMTRVTATPVGGGPVVTDVSFVLERR